MTMCTGWSRSDDAGVTETLTSSGGELPQPASTPAAMTAAEMVTQNGLALIRTGRS
jgi:hypothetical protein